MPKPSLQKIVPRLWYTREAEEAARFYAAVFPDSHVDRVTSLPADSAIGPAGSGPFIHRERRNNSASWLRLHRQHYKIPRLETDKLSADARKLSKLSG